MPRTNVAWRQAILEQARQMPAVSTFAEAAEIVGARPEWQAYFAKLKRRLARPVTLDVTTANGSLYRVEKVAGQFFLTKVSSPHPHFDFDPVIRGTRYEVEEPYPWPPVVGKRVTWLGKRDVLGWYPERYHPTSPVVSVVLQPPRNSQ